MGRETKQHAANHHRARETHTLSPVPARLGSGDIKHSDGAAPAAAEGATTSPPAPPVAGDGDGPHGRGSSRRWPHVVRSKDFLPGRGIIRIIRKAQQRVREKKTAALRALRRGSPPPHTWRPGGRGERCIRGATGCLQGVSLTACASAMRAACELAVAVMVRIIVVDAVGCFVGCLLGAAGLASQMSWWSVGGQVCFDAAVRGCWGVLGCC